MVVFMILYVDDILLIGNDVRLLSSMKDLRQMQYILGIKVLRDNKNRKLVISQATYIDKLLIKYVMQDSNKGLLSFRHCLLSITPYASVVGNIMYIVRKIRLIQPMVITLEGV
ncbi:hypothetical protein AAG906_041087 [Vitis piasezkii]